MFNLGPFEMALFGLIALMLFGKKLPEVARNFGGTYRDLRKSLSDFQREFQGWDRPDPRASSKPAWQQPEPEQEKLEVSAPKFIPPPPEEPAQGNPVEE